MRVRSLFLVFCLGLWPGYDSTLIAQHTDSLSTETNTLGQEKVTSDSTWFSGQYLNACSQLTERMSNSSQDYYESGITNPNISFRKQGPALMLVNDIPVNIYGVNIFDHVSNQADFRDFVSTPQSNLMYFSASEFQSMYASKNILSSASYGSFGKNGIISFSSYLPEKQGLSVEVNSGIWFTRNQNSSDQSILDGHTLRNGAKLGYRKKNIKTSLNLELLNQFLATNNPREDDAAFRGFNISSTNQYDITEQLQVDMFINYFRSNNLANIRYPSTWDEDQVNSRIISRLGLSYKLTKFLTIQAFGSNLNLVNRRTYQYGLNSVADIRDKWNQYYHSIKGIFEQTFPNHIGINASLAYNVLTRKFERHSSGNTFGLEYKFEDKFLASEITIDYMKWIYIGGFLNVQNTGLAIQNDNRFVSRGIHGAWDFSRLLKIEKLNSGVIRANLSQIEMPTSTWKSSEFGIDLSFANGQIDLSASYYLNSLDLPQVITQPTIGSSYTVYYYNNYDAEFSGFEFSINTKPTKNWQLNLNWSKNKYNPLDNSGNINSNYMLNLNNGALTGNATVGSPFGSLLGTGFLYSADSVVTSGTIDTTRDPLWTSNLFNSVSLGAFSMGCLVSYQYGGSTYDYNAETSAGGIGGGVLSNFYNGAYYWGNSTRNPSSIKGMDALILRNVYMSYELKKVLKTQSIHIGLAAKNLWSSTKLRDNRIPSETSGIFSSQTLKTYSINLRVVL